VHIFHSIQWFVSLGIHDAAWVQAITNVGLLVLSVFTLAALVIYAYDNHRLAKSSVSSLKLLLDQDERSMMESYAVAYDVFLAVQGDLALLLRTVLNGSLSQKQPAAICPANWPILSVAIWRKVPKAMKPWVSLNVALRTLDSSVKDYFGALTASELEPCLEAVKDNLSRTQNGVKDLIDALEEP